MIANRYLALLLLLFSILTFAACSDNRAEELFKTAQFEELQNNNEHAKQLYLEINNKYPESRYAGKAEERLSALGK